MFFVWGPDCKAFSALAPEPVRTIYIGTAHTHLCPNKVRSVLSPTRGTAFAKLVSTVDSQTRICLLTIYAQEYNKPVATLFTSVDKHYRRLTHSAKPLPILFTLLGSHMITKTSYHSFMTTSHITRLC